MRRLVAVLFIGVLAAVAIPGALVIASQRRELETVRQQRREFCFSEAIHAVSNTSLFEAARDPKFREMLALDMLRRHERGTILALCVPGTTVDASEEDSCWLAKGDPDCLAPYLHRLAAALEPWRR